MGKSYAKQSVQIAGMSFQTRSRQITLKGITDMRILLIEDNIELCTSLSYQLKAEGFELDICHNGEDGLHFIKEEAHDLILLDRMLPRMDGITVLRSTRRLNISTPIILITALGELQDRIIGLDCGADDYIVKPFAFEELTARIRCIFRRPQKWKKQPAFTFWRYLLRHGSPGIDLRPEGLFSFQTGGGTFGTIFEKWRADPAPAYDTFPRMGTRCRSGRRQSG